MNKTKHSPYATNKLGKITSPKPNPDSDIRSSVCKGDDLRVAKGKKSK